MTLVAACALLAAISIGGSRRTAISVTFAIAISTSLAAVYATAQSFGVEPFSWRAVDGTPTFSTFGNSTFMGAAAGVGATATVAAALLTRASLRPLWLLSGFALGFAAVTSRSNGFVLALIAGCAIFAWSARKVLGWWPLRIAVAAIGVAGVLATVGLLVPSLPGPAGAMGRAIEESMGPRSEYWSSAVRAYWDRPLQGWGPDTFGQVFPRYRSTRHAEDLGRLTDKVHNVPLERFTETGLFGGIAWILLIAQGLAAGLRPPEGRRDSLILAGGTGIVGAYVAQSLVSIDMTSLAIFMWAGLGVIECVRRQTTTDVDEPGTRQSAMPPSLLKLGAIAAVLALVATLFVGYRISTAEIAFTNALRQGTPTEDAEEHLRRAVRLNPWEARYWTALGLSLSSDATGSKTTEAIESAESAMRIEPGNPYHAYRLGRLHRVLADSYPAGSPQAESETRTAISWLRRALELNPNDPQTKREICQIELSLSGQTGLCGSP